MGWFTLDASELDKLQEAMNKSLLYPGPIVDSVLRNEGANLIKRNITMLLPTSGRKWKGKGRSAKAAMPASFKQEDGQLSVTIVARGKYHYLYFPDDGSNTIHHAGNQQFMRRGAEASSAKIIEMCVGRLLEGLND